MSRRRVNTIISLVLFLLLAGCQGQQMGISTGVGGIGGATAGGLLGAALGGGSTGIASGVLLGVSARRRRRPGPRTSGASRCSRRRSARALETAPVGTPSAWTNPDTGTRGSITPTRTFQNQSGAYCREFQQSIVVGGQTQQATSTACRQPDGSWRTQS